MPIFDSARGDVPYFALPNNSAALFGSSGASIQLEGTLSRQVSTAGISPAATGADNVLAVFAIPANSFDGAVIATSQGSSQSYRGIAISAQGSFAANTNNKRVKIVVGAASANLGSTVVGGTVIADTGTVQTSGAGWSLGAEIYKSGAAGSNTQLGVHQQAQIGAAVASLVPPQVLTMAENAPILVAVTGNATTAAADIVFNLLVVSGMN